MKMSGQFDTTIMGAAKHPKGELKVSASKPYKQGDLDFLCGVYAVVNSLRIACRSAGVKKRIVWRSVFNKVLEELENRKRLFEVHSEGMNLRTLCICIQAASEYLEKKYSIRVTRKIAWRRMKKLALRPAFKELQRLLSQPGNSAILRLEGLSLSHWTVVKSVGGDRVHFADSYSVRFKRVSECQFTKNAVFTSSKQWAVDSASLVLIRIEEIE